MDAKLKFEFLDRWNICFQKTIHKEESQDCVVPDTLPDIDQVICTRGSLLIRSKDISSGRLKLEGNIPAKIIFCDESGGVHCIEVNVPVYMSAENECLDENNILMADMRLTALETRLLNPRKVLVRAEISAEVLCYTKCQVAYAEGVEDNEHIHVRMKTARAGFISALTEKTFALTDEQALPSECAPGEIASASVESFVDEIKPLGNRLVVRGRVKSSLLVLNGSGLTPLEATTDFSQIVECSNGENTAISAIIIPSGAYHYISTEGEQAKLCMEFHMVVQIRCSETREFECLTDAYSNEHALTIEMSENKGERLEIMPGIRAGIRQLYEIKDLSEVICIGHMWGNMRMVEEKIYLPVSLQCVYLDSMGGIKSRDIDTELCFDCGTRDAAVMLSLPPELSECSISPLPGGVELRLQAQAQMIKQSEQVFSSIAAISYDENCPEDTSGKPSLVLLRATSEDDLWELARENCSTVDEIVRVNRLEEAEEKWEKLLLIPKSI